MPVRMMKCLNLRQGETIMKTTVKPCPIRTMAGGVGLLSLMAMGLSLPHTASAAPAKAPTASSKVMLSKNAATLFALGEGGENVYDAAKVGNWKTAASKTAGLEKAARILPPRWKAMANQFRLASSLGKLRAAVQGHQKGEAMHQANRVTLFAARLSRDSAPRVPVEVTLLDVYGRDLEIGALRGDRVYLARAQRDLAATWARIRAAVVARGGKRQARTFSALVARVEAASLPSQFTQLATPILDKVDNLEKVFEK